MKTTIIKQVLITLDYDETAKEVAEQGFAMAKAMNAAIILLHVISEQPIYYTAYTHMHEFQIDIMGDLKKTAQKYLTKVKKHLEDKSIITILREGEITDTILETANDFNVNIIVMGSHSRRWVEDILLGSATKSVLNKTSVPLFIVPTKNKLSNNSTNN